MQTIFRLQTVLAIALWGTANLIWSLPLQGEETISVAQRWWDLPVSAPILNSPQWVSFDLNAIVIDALAHNPRIAAVTAQAEIAMERIVQEDAVFDPAMLLGTGYGSTNDPVGNSLTTGGPDRLQQNSFNNRAGLVRTARDGTKVDLSQQAGLLNSNSLFFTPNNQGNTRLNLSITRPLQAGAGRMYNERLIVQARIDSKVSVQEMRDEVQQRLALTMSVYWRLYQTRCQLIQQRGLLDRGLEIEKLIEARREFDSGELEISKVNSRVLRRQDDLIAQERDLANLQTQLAALVASESLPQGQSIEMIPLGAPTCIAIDVDLHDAVVSAMSNRTEIRSAALELESASLAIAITRNELLPQLNAVVGGYLAALNANNDVYQSLGDQFASRPGFNGGLEYQRPYGRRAAQSRHRAAHQHYLEMSERYREAVANTQAEVETAARNLQTATTRLSTKQQVWEAACKQEYLVRCRWDSVGSDGRHAALILEDLLDQQERRTAAEQDVVASEVEYILALVELQQAMGTLLMTEGIEPTKIRNHGIEWSEPSTGNSLPVTSPISPPNAANSVPANSVPANSVPATAPFIAAPNAEIDAVPNAVAPAVPNVAPNNSGKPELLPPPAAVQMLESDPEK